MQIFKILFMICATLLTIFAFGLISGFFVWILWNWLMPDIFGLQFISIWQAWGLTLLCGLLFKANVNSKTSDK